MWGWQLLYEGARQGLDPRVASSISPGEAFDDDRSSSVLMLIMLMLEEGGVVTAAAAEFVLGDVIAAAALLLLLSLLFSEGRHVVAFRPTMTLLLLSSSLAGTIMRIAAAEKR